MGCFPRIALVWDNGKLSAMFPNAPQRGAATGGASRKLRWCEAVENFSSCSPMRLNEALLQGVLSANCVGVRQWKTFRRVPQRAPTRRCYRGCFPWLTLVWDNGKLFVVCPQRAPTRRCYSGCFPQIALVWDNGKLSVVFPNAPQRVAATKGGFCKLRWCETVENFSSCSPMRLNENNRNFVGGTRRRSYPLFQTTEIALGYTTGKLSIVSNNRNFVWVHDGEAFSVQPCSLHSLPLLSHWYY